MAINIYTCSMSRNVFQQRKNLLSLSIKHLTTSNFLHNEINHSLLDPKIVLSEKNREDCVKRLKKLTSISQFVRKDKDRKDAAVLIPLCLHKNELGFLYTLRSRRLSTNGGQVSFPGGIKDDTDEDHTATAIRETWEELGIPEENIEIWAQGSLIERRDVGVMPILGFIGEINLGELKINHHEVEEAFVVSLKHLCDLKNCRYTQFRTGFTLPTFIGTKHHIWGLTALITHMTMLALVPDVYKHKIRFIRSFGKLYKYHAVNKLFT